MAEKNKTLPSTLSRVLLILTHHMVPETEDISLANRDETLLKDFALMINEFSKFTRWGLFWGLRFFEWFPFLFGFGLSRFSSLSFQKQETYIDQWANSNIYIRREFFKALKSLTMVVGYSDKRLWPYMGYDPDSHMIEKIELRKKLIEVKKDGVYV